jgi:hypothetical protein
MAALLRMDRPLAVRRERSVSPAPSYFSRAPSYHSHAPSYRSRNSLDEERAAEAGDGGATTAPISTTCQFRVRLRKCNVDCATGARKYCADHKCSIGLCDAAHEKGHAFCHDHKCYVDWCSNANDGVTYWCVSHRCTSRGCVQPLRNWNFVGRGQHNKHRHCTIHTCSARRCVNKVAVKKNAVGSWCPMHCCQEPSGVCLAKRGGGKGRYCSRHRCPVDGCFFSRVVLMDDGSVQELETCVAHA